jgi:hypothetical protein
MRRRLGHREICFKLRATIFIITVNRRKKGGRAIMEVVCLGLSCVDVLVRGFDRMTAFQGEIREVESIKLGVGGDAVNQAMTLSRLGVSAKLV